MLFADKRVRAVLLAAEIAILVTALSCSSSTNEESGQKAEDAASQRDATVADVTVMDGPEKDPDGSATEPDGPALLADGAAWPACTWPSYLDGPDASGRTTCVPSRTLLECGFMTCATDDPTRCPGFTAPVESCTPQCNVNEYVATCGGIGPGNVPEPPAGCRMGFPTPAGFAHYCCPCE